MIKRVQKAMLLLTAVVLAVSSANAQAVDDQFKEGSLYYKITSLDPNEVAVVPEEEDGYNGQEPTGDISIPKSISYNNNSYKVTSIGHSVFKDCTGLTSVTIPNSVTNIENYAFRKCTGLTSVTIGNSVTYIGEYAFEKCSSLTSITIPNSVTYIGGGAFAGCTGLTDIQVSSENTAYTSDNGVLFNKAKTEIITCTASKKGNYTIPNSVTNIGGNAFAGCKGLTSITIPNSVTNIGNRAFDECKGLTNVTIPNSVTYIGDYAFYSCIGLTNVTIPNSVTNIGNQAFFGCTGLTSIYSLIKDLSEVALGDDVFDEVDTTTCTLYVPKGKVDDYKNAEQWKDFNKIEELKFEKNGLFYNIIGEGKVELTYQNDAPPAWNDDKKPTGELNIPESVSHNGNSYKVTNIGLHAFEICTGLTSVSIPSSVTNIGEFAFGGCSGLTDIQVSNGNTVYSSDNGVLLNKEKTELILCPEGKKGNYTIPNSVTNIGKRAFDYCSGLTSITIPNSVTNIGKRAFDYCSGLTSICSFINDVSKVNLGEDVFYNVNP